MQCSEADFRKLGCFGLACSSFGNTRANTLTTLSHRSPGRSLSGDASLIVLDPMWSLIPWVLGQWPHHQSRAPPSRCSATGLGGGAGLTLSLPVSAQDFSLRGLQ